MVTVALKGPVHCRWCYARAHAREREHKEWFTITETAAMDSVPLVCRLLFQDQSKLLEATHIDVEGVATRLMNIVGMLAVDEADVETAFDAQ